MATYYRWRRRTVSYNTEFIADAYQNFPDFGNTVYTMNQAVSIVDGAYDFSAATALSVGSQVNLPSGYFAFSRRPTKYYYNQYSQILYGSNYVGSPVDYYELQTTYGSTSDYVYSTSSSAYPNGGVSGSYYYDQRTTITSPTAPSGLTYPATITTPSVSISWAAATSSIPNYTVSQYEVSYSTNGGSSWAVAGTTAETSYAFSIPAGTTSIMFRVRAIDTNSQYGDYVTGTASTVLLAPTLTVPQMMMQGQQATINWTSIDGADSYTVQRKANTDTDWTQVYSGAALTFAETVGTWTSVQYRVCAVFDEMPGGWATSESIPVVSASALAISGTDGDLGTLVNDVTYTVSSDGSTELTVTEIINGTETRTFTATNGATNKIPVVDLPTGYGTIKITASTNPGSGVVTVTREWTYTKAAITFPDAGSVADLTQQGKTIWAKTIAEAVRTPSIWGGNLGLALEKLARSVLYNRTQKAKYTEVTVNLANVTEGQIISLPENGQMVEFYVAKLDYESALNGAGRVLLVRKDCYDLRAWDADNVNAYATSDIDTWMNGDYKGLFPEEIQTAMGTTEFYYTPGNGTNTVTTLERPVFALSLTELGRTSAYANTEGSELPIASTLLIAYRNGSATTQWTRSAYKDYDDGALWINSTGGVNGATCSSINGARPCFTLPTTFSATYYVGSNGTVHDEQEYKEAGTFTDISGGTIPMVSIETGSYVGTGTFGASNPNTLTFPFKPKMIMIQRHCDTGDSMVNTDAIEAVIVGTGRVYVRYISSPGTTVPSINITEFSETVSWYSNSANAQMNTGSTYDYVAIGLAGGAT